MKTEYTAGEREYMLAAMKRAASQFYSEAVKIGFHQFVEMSGFINELIKVCEDSHLAGVDFATTPLKLKHYNAEYIAEKLECIYGHSLVHDPVVREAFQVGLFGTVENPK